MRSGTVSMRRILREPCPSGHSVCLLARCWLPAAAGRLEKRVDRLKDEFDEAPTTGMTSPEIEAFLKLYRLALKMARALDRLGAA